MHGTLKVFDVILNNCKYFVVLFRESAKRQNGYHRDIYYRTPCDKRMVRDHQRLMSIFNTLVDKKLK